MKLEYTYEDIKSALEFGRNNPKGTIKEWLSIYNNTLTEEERKTFKFIDVAKIPVIDNKFLYLLKWTGVGGGWYSKPFDIFARKYFPDYYFFSPTEYSESWLITPDDIFKEKFYDNHEEFPKILHKVIELENNKVSIINRTFDEGYVNNRSYKYWAEGYWEVYIKDINKFEFKNAIQLLEERN